MKSITISVLCQDAKASDEGDIVLCGSKLHMIDQDPNTHYILNTNIAAHKTEGINMEDFIYRCFF